MPKSILSLVLLLSIFGGLQASASAAPLIAKPGKLTSPIREGSVIGGQADIEFSLIGVESKEVSSGERIIVSLGDSAGRAWKGEPGFFNAVIDRSSKRLVIDLSQVSKTRLDATALRKAFAKSRFVQSTDITMDPHDGSTNITLELKSPVVLLAATDARGNGQVIFELRPAGDIKK